MTEQADAGPPGIPEAPPQAPAPPAPPASQAAQEGAFGGGPPAWLYLPTDWFNFLEDGQDADAAASRYAELMAKVFPRMPLAGHQEIIHGLMLWRERLWSNGMLAHGIISVPRSEEFPAAMWQVLVTTMRLPAVRPELDPAALLRRLVPASELAYIGHTETYETEMGLGIGVMGRPPITLPGAAPAPGPGGEPPVCGMAAALSFAPGAEYGILAVGVSVDPEQDRMIATLIALIAGKSRLVTDQDGHSGGEKPAEPAAPEPRPATA